MSKRGLVLAALCWAAALDAAPRTATAQERVVFGWDGRVGADGVPRPWRFRKWAPLLGRDYTAESRVVESPGGKALYVKSVRSGFIVGTKRDVDVSVYRNVSWSWKAETLPRGASFKRRGTNDQALQLLFGFEGGKVVGYIWDSTGRAGASGSGLAWREDVRVIVVEAGPSKVGRWITENRNLHEDFRRLFDRDPPTLKGVAVQSNSQHTRSAGAGYVGKIVLSR